MKHEIPVSPSLPLLWALMSLTLSTSRLKIRWPHHHCSTFTQPITITQYRPRFTVSSFSLTRTYSPRVTRYSVHFHTSSYVEMTKLNWQYPLADHDKSDVSKKIQTNTGLSVGSRFRVDFFMRFYSFNKSR